MHFLKNNLITTRCQYAGGNSNILYEIHLIWDFNFEKQKISFMRKRNNLIGSRSGPFLREKKIFYRNKPNFLFLNQILGKGLKKGRTAGTK